MGLLLVALLALACGAASGAAWKLKVLPLEGAVNGASAAVPAGLNRGGHPSGRGVLAWKLKVLPWEAGQKLAEGAPPAFLAVSKNLAKASGKGLAG